MEKICRRCNVEKELSEYYAHKQMADGHVNICKECKKGYAVYQYDKNMQSFEWKLKERKRTRERNLRLGYAGKYDLSRKEKRKTMLLHKEKYPEKYKAIGFSQHIKAPKGLHKHHWSYNKEHYKDIIFLSVKDHNMIHCYIEYFQPAKMYKTIFGEPLYTKERFIKFMDYVLSHSHDEIINNFYKNN